MNGSFLFLGTGGSAGIPAIGCKCAVCRSANSRNHRLRPAGLIRAEGKSLLIDAGPDLRQQALKYGIDNPDGLLLTHTHFDHIAGIDELRVFYVRTKKAFPCLLSQDSYEELKKRYYYLFEPKKPHTALSAQFEFQILKDDMGMVEFCGIPIGYCSFFQGDMRVTGFRVGDFAYISDIRKYDASIFSFLKGVRTMVLSALMPERSQFHLSFDEAVQFAKEAGVRHTWLTHLNHAVEHEAGNALLPSDVRLGYDGLELEFSF